LSQEHYLEASVKGSSVYDQVANWLKGYERQISTPMSEHNIGKPLIAIYDKEHLSDHVISSIRIIPN
jgi:hypothetical protein